MREYGGYRPLVGSVGLVVGLPLNLAGRLNPFTFGAARSEAGQVAHQHVHDADDDGPEASVIATYAQDFCARLLHPDAQPFLQQIET